MTNKEKLELAIKNIYYLLGAIAMVENKGASEVATQVWEFINIKESDKP